MHLGLAFVLIPGLTYVESLVSIFGATHVKPRVELQLALRATEADNVLVYPGEYDRSLVRMA